MIVHINNRSFSEISRVNLSGEGQYLHYIKAGSSRISEPDIIETDLKYFQDKLEFTGPSVLNNLEESQKNQISRIGMVEKYLMTLFPTMIGGETGEDDIEYFSTYNDTLGNELLCLLVPEGISNAHLVEDTGYAFLTIADIGFEESEIGFSKVLYVVTSYDSTSPRTLNLSWEAYRGDRNPNKVMSDYVLRNDSLVPNHKGYREESGYVYSSISSSLVGTERVEERPIYNLLKKFAGDRSWNRSRRYSIGDRIVMGDIEYESVEPDNIGNHPYYSRMWSKIYDN